MGSIKQNNVMQVSISLYTVYISLSVSANILVLCKMLQYLYVTTFFTGKNKSHVIKSYYILEKSNFHLNLTLWGAYTFCQCWGGISIQPHPEFVLYFTYLNLVTDYLDGLHVSLCPTYSSHNGWHFMAACHILINSLINLEHPEHPCSSCVS